MTKTNPRKPSALIGFSDGWMSRSMETVFEEKGYEVLRVPSGKQALKLARRGRYEVIMLDEQLAELNGIDVCIALRDDPLFDHATPIVIISSSHSTLPTRNAAYAAGAWEYFHQPVDVDALFLKLGTFRRARQELAAAMQQSLTDPASGLYTPLGLQRLAEQLEARAVRNHEPFACLAFSPQPSSTRADDSANADDAGHFADAAFVVREQARRSDVVAKTGEARLALLAPDTDAAGARLLVARLQRALDTASKRIGAVRLRVGYCAVSDLAASNLDVSDLVNRAESALAHLDGSEKGDSVASFDDISVS